MAAQLKLIQEGKENMDRQKALEAALAQIDRAFGKGSAMKLGSKETMQVATAAGGRVVGAASIVDRSGGRAAFDVPFAALLKIDLPTYEPDRCPLCAQGMPVIKPGSRPVAT